MPCCFVFRFPFEALFSTYSIDQLSLVILSRATPAPLTSDFPDLGPLDLYALTKLTCLVF